MENKMSNMPRKNDAQFFKSRYTPSRKQFRPFRVLIAKTVKISMISGAAIAVLQKKVLILLVR